MRLHRSSSARGLAIVVVIWAIAISSLLTASLLVFALRQSTIGVEAQERISARWAARAGIEATLAKMSELTIYPEPDDALLLYLEMESVATGETGNGSWSIQHAADNLTEQWAGPMDEHSKLNVNNEDLRGLLALIFYPLAFGVMDSITDWIDEDDEPNALGVERDWYLSLDARYEPRNGPIWHVAEMELIAGIEPEDIRGEDWNLNYRRDDSEDDGDQTFPIDEPDRMLDAGWSEFLTARSRGGGPTSSGLPRLWLEATDPLELVERLGLSLNQAQNLVTRGRDPDFSLSDLVLENRPRELQSQSRFQLEGSEEQSEPSTAVYGVQEVTSILDEVGLAPDHRPEWGKININTVPAKLLYEIFQDDERIADDILAMRTARAQGITSLVDLWELPNMDEQLMGQLLRLFTTHSNVFTIVSRGKSKGSRQEAEIIAVVDRSTIPIKILEYRED